MESGYRAAMKLQQLWDTAIDDHQKYLSMGEE